jgi:predicted NBD/HSP70 family sugar kinase
MLERIPVSSPAGVAIFRKILTHGPIARIDVAKSTGLSAAAVTKAVSPLIAAGYIEDARQSSSEIDRADISRGRPTSPLVISSSRAHIIGVKVTATEVYGVLTDLTAQRIANTSQLTKSSRVEDVETAIKTVVELLKESSPTGTVDGLGVTVSGDVDAHSGRVRDSPLMKWRDVALGPRLESLLGLPTMIENDVRALTVAEQMFGLGADSESFAVVTIGAGIGCGIFVNGRVVEGSHGVSGEIGHLPLAPGNLVCSCGRRGCVETIASSQAILNRVRVGLDDPSITMQHAIQFAHEGEVSAVSAFAEAGDVIGAALAAMVNLIGPERVIIAGEGVAEYDLLADRIRSTFSEHAFGSALDCELILLSHTFDDWALGAAVTVIRQIAEGIGQPLPSTPHLVV